MQNDKKIENNPDVCKKILKKFGKPENYFMCKTLNVYNDRYRVNVYVQDPIDDLTGHKQYIHSSYFCKYDGKKLSVLS